MSQLQFPGVAASADVVIEQHYAVWRRGHIDAMPPWFDRLTERLWNTADWYGLRLEELDHEMADFDFPSRGRTPVLLDSQLVLRVHQLMGEPESVDIGLNESDDPVFLCTEEWRAAVMPLRRSAAAKDFPEFFQELNQPAPAKAASLLPLRPLPPIYTQLYWDRVLPLLRVDSFGQFHGRDVAEAFRELLGAEPAWHAESLILELVSAHQIEVLERAPTHSQSAFSWLWNGGVDMGTIRPERQTQDKYRAAMWSDTESNLLHHRYKLSLGEHVRYLSISTEVSRVA